MTLRSSSVFAFVVFACAALLACAHAEEKPSPTASAGTTSATTPCVATAQPIGAPVDPSSEPDEVSGCATADDCAFTRVAAGACCPLMCSPRVVTKHRAGVLEKAIPACNKGQECPLPPCRPPQSDFRIACEQKKCVMKITPLRSENLR